MDGDVFALSATVLLAFFIKKLVDFFRLVAGTVRAEPGALGGLTTQLVAWVAGLIGIFVFANTDFAVGFHLGSVAIANAGFWTLLFAGLMLGSAGSVVKDTLKARDSSQTEAVPKLLRS